MDNAPQSMSSSMFEQMNSYLFRLYAEEDGIDMKQLYSVQKVIKGVVARETIFSSYFDNIEDITRYESKAAHNSRKINSKIKANKSYALMDSSHKLTNTIEAHEETIPLEAPQNFTNSVEFHRRSISQYDQKLAIKSVNTLEVKPIQEGKTLKKSPTKIGLKKYVNCDGIHIDSRTTLPTDDIFASNFFSPSLMCSMNSSVFIKQQADMQAQYVGTKDEAINVDLNDGLEKQEHYGWASINQSIEESKDDKTIEKDTNDSIKMPLVHNEKEPSKDRMRAYASNRAKGPIKVPPLCNKEGKTALSEIADRLKKKLVDMEKKVVHSDATIYPKKAYNKLLVKTKVVQSQKNYHNVDHILEEAKKIVSASKRKKKILKLPGLKKPDPYSLANSNRVLETYFNIKIEEGGPKNQFRVKRVTTMGPSINKNQCPFS